MGGRFEESDTAYVMRQRIAQGEFHVLVARFGAKIPPYWATVAGVRGDDYLVRPTAIKHAEPPHAVPMMETMLPAGEPPVGLMGVWVWCRLPNGDRFTTRIERVVPYSFYKPGTGGEPYRLIDADRNVVHVDQIRSFHLVDPRPFEGRRNSRE